MSGCPHDLAEGVGERVWDEELESYKHRTWRCTACGAIETMGADGWSVPRTQLNDR